MTLKYLLLLQSQKFGSYKALHVVVTSVLLKKTNLSYTYTNSIPSHKLPDQTYELFMTMFLDCVFSLDTELATSKLAKQDF